MSAKSFELRRSLRWLVLATGTCAVLCLAPLAQGASTDTQMMYVTFLSTNTFSVTLPGGTAVGQPTAPGTTITPGTYELVFDNTANVKNLDFQITGPNVSLQESMDGGEETAAGDYVTFLPSSQYLYHDGNNINSQTFYLQTSATGGSVGGTGSGLPGSNTSVSTGTVGNTSAVGSKSSTSTTPAKTTPVVLRGTLNATIGAGGKVALSRSGKAVTTLEAGKYKIAVTDTTAKDGFTIRGINANPVAASGVSFVGKHTITVTLTAGQWLYYASLGTKSHYFLVTAA